MKNEEILYMVNSNNYFYGSRRVLNVYILNHFCFRYHTICHSIICQFYDTKHTEIKQN